VGNRRSASADVFDFAEHTVSPQRTQKTQKNQMNPLRSLRFFAD
jgi:hypothetical protein